MTAAQLRAHNARKALAAAECTCEPHGVGCRSYNTGCDGDCDCNRKHDPFWVVCPRSIAETELTEALRAFGVEP